MHGHTRTYGHACMHVCTYACTYIRSSSAPCLVVALDQVYCHAYIKSFSLHRLHNIYTRRGGFVLSTSDIHIYIRPTCNHMHTHSYIQAYPRTPVYTFTQMYMCTPIHATMLAPTHSYAHHPNHHPHNHSTCVDACASIHIAESGDTVGSASPAGTPGPAEDEGCFLILSSIHNTMQMYISMHWHTHCIHTMGRPTQHRCIHTYVCVFIYAYTHVRTHIYTWLDPFISSTTKQCSCPTISERHHVIMFAMIITHTCM